MVSNSFMSLPHLLSKVFPSLPTFEYKKYSPFIERGANSLTRIESVSPFTLQKGTSSSIGIGWPLGAVKRKSEPSGEIEIHSTESVK